jgi:acylglycerol lipase
MISTPVKSEVCIVSIPPPLELSHDKAVNAAYMQDPLIQHRGSMRGVSDMLDAGGELLRSGYQRWPKQLPLLLVHGTEDKVTSFRASQQFHERLPASNKTLSLNEGGYHELHNEPDGVKEKLFEECVRWIENHSRADQQRADRSEGAVGGSGTSEQAKL